MMEHDPNWDSVAGGCYTFTDPDLDAKPVTLYWIEVTVDGTTHCAWQYRSPVEEFHAYPELFKVFVDMLVERVDHMIYKPGVDPVA